MDSIDRAVLSYVNRKISEVLPVLPAAEGYSRKQHIDAILQNIRLARQNPRMCDNTLISVCADHFFFVRYQMLFLSWAGSDVAEAFYRQVNRTYSDWKINGLVGRTSSHCAPSEYDRKHSVWEHRGYLVGRMDQRHPNDRLNQLSESFIENIERN